MDDKTGFQAIPNATVAKLHETYTRLTGFQLSLNQTFSREYQWGVFMTHGWGPDELALVILYIKRHHKDYWPSMCRFTKLVCDPAGFEEYLAMAKAEQRNARKPPTERQQVLAASGRPPEPAKAQERQVDAIAADLLKDGYDKMKRELEQL